MFGLDKYAKMIYKHEHDRSTTKCLMWISYGHEISRLTDKAIVTKTETRPSPFVINIFTAFQGTQFY